MTLHQLPQIGGHLVAADPFTVPVVTARRGHAFFGSPSPSIIDVSYGSSVIADRVRSTHEVSTPRTFKPVSVGKSVEETLFDTLAAFKISTSQVAMHIDLAWRDKLFWQLDSLLSAEEWDAQDAPPTIMSFRTFLRMIVLLKPDRRPGLGATSDGKLIATWTVEKNRLTIDCLPDDQVRWHVIYWNAETRDSVAGVSHLSRLAAVLSPFNLKQWLQIGD